MNPSQTPSLFGAKTTPSLFSSPGGSPGGLFSLAKPTFGQTSQATQPAFGQTNQIAQTPFGQTPQVAQTAFGQISQPTFGSPSTQPSLFGAKPQSLFGGLSNTPLSQSTVTQPAFGALANPISQSSFGFGTQQTGFAAKPQTPFGVTTNTSLNFSNNTFGTAQQTISQDDLFIESISQPSLFGDERDSIISRWNQLQAMWGYGSGLTSKGKAVYAADNYLARFKSVSYNEVPNCDDSEGYVSLLIRRPYAIICNDTTLLHEKLHQLINNSTLNISIVDVRPAIKAFINNTTVNQPKFTLGFTQTAVPVSSSSNISSEELCDVFIKVTENMPNGPARVVPSTMLVSFLKAEPLKSKLETELLIIDVVPQFCPNQKEITDYLNGPAPRGLDVELWEKAKQQSPNPNTLLPVPVIGIVELKARINGQVEFAKSQLSTIRKEAAHVSEMKTKAVMMTGKIDQLKRKQMELSNRILKVMCRHEIIRKQGYSLSAEEETLKCTLDKLWSQLVGSYGLKSRLQETLSTNISSFNGGTKFNSKLSYNNVTHESMNELTGYLTERQQSIKEMMSLLREDIACLNVIEKS